MSTILVVYAVASILTYKRDRQQKRRVADVAALRRKRCARKIVPKPKKKVSPGVVCDDCPKTVHFSQEPPVSVVSSVSSAAPVKIVRRSSSKLMGPPVLAYAKEELPGRPVVILEGPPASSPPASSRASPRRKEGPAPLGNSRVALIWKGLLR
jgi:hypothetical protein